jgi:hypothetical protein
MNDIVLLKREIIMNKKQIVVFLIFITLIGCAGRTANPVPIEQNGDLNLTCEGIQRELDFIETEVKRLAPETQKTGKNTALGVAGAFLIVPWFFMDFGKAEQVEVDAYRRRYNHLLALGDEKKCGFDKQQIPDPTPKEPANKEPSK